MTFTLIIIYDAINVRFEAGQHAHHINKLRFELQGVLFKEETKETVKEAKKSQLKERI
jgi:acid phosphatase family membrane protein YuiD